MYVKKTSKITMQNIFCVICFAVLFLGFYDNFWSLARKESFNSRSFDEFSECLAIGRIARSEKEGVFSHGALPGVNYDPSVMPPNADIWFEVYLKQRTDYVADDIPDSYQTYKSQSGGQFILYGILQQVLPLGNDIKLQIYYCINAVLSALCFTLLLGWVFRNFGLITGIITLLFIMMSSWLTFFGNSLWWGLWASYIPFITMLLVMEYNHRTKKLSSGRILFYLFLSVFAKCVFNGYEFISTALVATMCPIIFYSFFEKQKLRSFISYFIKASLTAIIAVLAQMLILITQIRIVTGSFAAGIDYIITSYTRRSFSADDDLAHYPYSFIFKKYLKGDVFQWDFLSRDSHTFYFAYLILLIAVLGVVVFYLSKNLDQFRKRFNQSLLLTTIVSSIAPISWLIVFKQHSVNHFHLDYIVWYMPFLLFGFVIVGEGISLILEKFAIYKRTLHPNSIHTN